MQPLYRYKQLKQREPEGNRGLNWNKFFHHWTNDFREIRKPNPGQNYLGGKQEWIKEFVGPSPDVGDATKRIRNLVEKLGGRCQELKTTAPFVTGMGLAHPVENGFLWHHTLGVPYLPGSSVKGLVRAWVEHWLQADRETLHCLFGKETQPGQEGCVGNLIFFDAFPVGNVNLIAEVMTPHDGGWRQREKDEEDNQTAPSDWHNPNPIPFLAIAPGARFQFCIAPRPGGDATEEDAETAMNCLEEALQWLGAGAKTAVGFGRFEDEKSCQEGEAAGGGGQPPAIRIGDRVADQYGETGVVRRIEGDEAVVDIDGEEYRVSLDELRRL